MSRVTLIQHINIPISNRERTREWYEKVLGAEFLDRGPELNQRQLQLRIGSAEIHTTDTPNPAPSGHFAVEIPDWEEMIANLDALGVRYAPPTIRAYSGGHSTYIQDPDGNRIELVQHPLGVQDSAGNKVELPHDPKSLTWTRLPGYGPSV
jgi:catechol 2,3-dioxygenase-like lactoylglutathione lyase family enzyme